MKEKTLNPYQRLQVLEKQQSEISDLKFEVLRKENDWLKDYRGFTYSDQLKDLLTRGLFEEHAKKADVGFANIEKAMVFCIEPSTMEILELGGSCLLREKRSEKKFESMLQYLTHKHRKVIPDLILDNFGWLLAGMFASNVSGFGAFKDYLGAAYTSRFYTATTSDWMYSTGETAIWMGSDGSAPTRDDYHIHTVLGNAPENAAIFSNTPAYTVSNTVIYQADANPTGGAGTVNEIGSFTFGITPGPVGKSFMMARDAISSVPYSAGKLLRGAYTWQI